MWKLIVGWTLVLGVSGASGRPAVLTWRRTNGPLLGAVVCGLLVTWHFVAGQATHV